MAKDSPLHSLSASRRTVLGAIGAAPGIVGGRLNRRHLNIFSDSDDTRSKNNLRPDVDIPPYPDDPFIIPFYGPSYLDSWTHRGWENETNNEEIRTVLRLHPGLYSTKELARFREGEVATDAGLTAQLDFALRAGLPATAGWNTTLNVNNSRTRYGQFFESRSWRFPDGENVTKPRDVFAETFNGDPHIMDWNDGDGGVPSSFSPATPQFLLHVAEKRLKQGASGFFVDGPGTKSFHGLDFSEWARNAFQIHLESLPEKRRSELGVETPSSFQIKEYIENNNLAPESNTDPREDPVFREYVLFHHLGIKEYMSKFREGLHNRFPDRMSNGEISIFANQFLGGLGNPQANNIYISDFVDVINTEHFPVVQPANDHVYKIQQALGRFKKPATAQGDLRKKDVGGNVDVASSPSMFQRFQAAEAYANGVKLKLPLTGSSSIDTVLTHYIEGDGSIDDQLKSFIDFLWGHKRFLDNTAPNNPVAVIWSLPDRVFRRLPQWQIGVDNPPGVDSFLGTIKLLREAQLPYDVLIFGHSRLWDDTDQRDRLDEYDVVILPGITAISDDQVSSLASYLDAGGSLISSNDTPERTEMWVKRDDLNALFDHANATILRNNPGRLRERDGVSKGNLVQAIDEAGVSTYTIRDDSSISVNQVSKPDSPVTIVHVLNHDYDFQTDSFSTKREIELSLPTPAHDVNFGRYYSPQRVADVDLTRDGDSITTTIPELVEWGFIAIAASESDLSHTEYKKSAKEAVKKAENRLQQAREDGRDWSSDFAIGEMKYKSAQTAMNSDAFRQAERIASQSIEAVNRTTYRQPRIAIDQAHGQPESQSGEISAVSAMQSHFEFPEYKVIKSWSGDVLEDVDVLLVPPALGFKDANYGYTPEELDQIEAFVANGGSLAVFARGGVASDIDDLTTRFGYRFQHHPIYFPTEEYPYAEVFKSRHELTRLVPKLAAEWGASIERTPEHSIELAKLPSDTPAWISTQRPHDERQENEESAANATLYAASQFGKGWVVMMGTTAYILPPADHFNSVMGNMLTFLSREGIAPNKSKATPATTTTETPVTTSSQRQTSTPPSGTTEAEGPGMGLLAGLIGIVAGGIALLRYLSDQED